MRLEQAPPITLSTLDYERLEALLDQPQWRGNPQSERLRQEMERAELVEPQGVPPTLVTMNSTLRCMDLNTREERCFTLVYPRDADADAGRVSVLAPLGSALLGLSVGQSIHWPVPEGVRHLRVEGLDYQPEAAGELHR
ncbi:MAG: nucleoside diphosphate kinase regulator [Halothiobacillaceae bacterium]|jgi:regulator of nucleoside diphosphate kinase|nr:nucleoside diphosphate kinase regulator [Halothiobacillaceae bacterium]MDY0049367.1 nucleoside diphosphate kinase regulator [Halothiobacillaceae bacterium]